MRTGLAVAGALVLLLMPALGRAAETTPETGRICRVNLAPAKITDESLNAVAGAAAAAKAIQAAHCEAGDVLELGYAAMNPAPVVAGFCDLTRQVYVFTPPPIYAQVGITSELVCALVGARRMSR